MGLVRESRNGRVGSQGTKVIHGVANNTPNKDICGWLGGVEIAKVKHIDSPTNAHGT